MKFFYYQKERKIKQFGLMTSFDTPTTISINN